MNRALIDTDILSYYFKGDRIVTQNFRNYLKNFSKIEISVITHYEIMGGLLAKKATTQLKYYNAFIVENNIVPLTEESVNISAELYANLRQTGKIVENIDLLIAGIAIEDGMVLITNNESHFARLTEISNLRIENWKKT